MFGTKWAHDGRRHERQPLHGGGHEPNEVLLHAVGGHVRRPVTGE